MVQPSAWDSASSPTASRFVANGLYIGGLGNIALKTVDGSVLTFVSASGFVPGMVSAISGSSTTTEILALR